MDPNQYLSTVGWQKSVAITEMEYGIISLKKKKKNHSGENTARNTGKLLIFLGKALNHTI